MVRVSWGYGMLSVGRVAGQVGEEGEEFDLLTWGLLETG